MKRKINRGRVGFFVLVALFIIGCALMLAAGAFAIWVSDETLEAKLALTGGMLMGIPLLFAILLAGDF